MTASTSRRRAGRGPALRGPAPRLTVEAGLHADGHLVVGGVDEVGRGALCGPVSVGVVLVHAGVARPPRGLRDSKLLAPEQRRALVPRISAWAQGAHAVGHASADEIDAIGILAAMRVAAARALAALPARPDVLLLDGNHDYLSDPAQPDGWPPVRTLVKADLRCASVAAASVLAKTTRDAIMVAMAAEHPAYGLDVHKGYATPTHRAALREHGPCEQHRRSWRLIRPDDMEGDEPGTGGPGGTRGDADGGDWQP